MTEHGRKSVGLERVNLHHQIASKQIKDIAKKPHWSQHKTYVTQGVGGKNKIESVSGDDLDNFVEILQYCHTQMDEKKQRCKF